MSKPEKSEALRPSRLEQQALSEKAFAAERRLAVIRLMVVAANSILYWSVLDKRGTVPWLANAVIAASLLYGLYVRLAEPYRRYPILLSSYFTSWSDSALIMLWLYATGGFASSFYLLLYISMLAIAFRYPAPQTFLASLVYSGSYLVLLWLTRELGNHWDEVAVRIIYVFIAALLGVAISSEIYAQTTAKLRLQEMLNEEERTRRQEAEAGERRYRFLAESMPQIVWTANPQGKIDYLNQRLASYVGRFLEPGPDSQWTAYVHPDDLSAAKANWQRSVQTGDPYEQEVRLRGKDGIYRWFLSRAIPMRESGGKVVTWYGTSTDIEEMKRVEAELQKAIRVREEFLAVAGHELKTPLAALQLQVQGIQHAAAKTLEPDGLGKILDRLARASGQLRGLDRLVNNLLDVSRMGEGKLLLNPEFVDLTRLVREVIATYADAAQKIGSAVRLSAPERLVGNWDRLRIEQVVTNLLANGLKYGRGKPVEIEVERDGDTATLRVRDHGIGIDSEQQARIFDRFARAVSDREFGGLGLGLWIVRRIVEASGGRVTVQSAAGRGATFTVRLPITSASSIRVTSDRNAAEAEPP